MRFKALLCSFAWFSTLASTLFLHAQFQEPTQEELQMTADPKAPGAAAVYLNFTEIADDPLHYQSVYARIKVLQEKGKELATIEIPYNRGSRRIKEIRGRTIHPDGTISKLTAKPEDLLWSKNGDTQIRRMVFTLPNVEVGSILEYYYQQDYDDEHFSSPYWMVQKRYFVHKAHYAFTPFKAFAKGSQAVTSQYLIDERGNKVNSLIWWTQLPKDAKLVTDVNGRYSLDVTDIPPIPHEDWMPPIHNLLYQVLFYYKSAVNGVDFWQSETKRWSKEVDHFAEPTKAIQDAVASLVAPSDSEVDKAKKLYAAVQGLENTDFTREKSKAELKVLGLHRAKRAEDTWAQKGGSRQDIVLLYLAMLRAAHLNADDMRVVNRDSGIFTPGYMDFDQLDDDLVILNTGGKDMILDPGEKMCPFGHLAWKHAGAEGVREAANNLNVAETPLETYVENVDTRLADLTLGDHGQVSGNLRYVMTGQDALYWRQQALLKDEDEVKKEFDRMLAREVPDGVEAHIDHFLELNRPDANLMAIVQVKGVLGVSTSKRMMLPGFFFEAREHEPFVEQAERTEPVDMHYAERVIDQVVYRLPEGVTVEGAPKDDKVVWPSQAVLQTQTLVKPSTVTIVRSLARGFTFLGANQYQDLRGFYQKVAEHDQEQLVLTQATQAKGQ